MGTTVKQYTRKVGGKTITVKQHSRVGGESHSHLLDRIKDRKVADGVAAKYKEFPNTLGLMLNAKWGDVPVTRYKTDKGERKPYQTTARRPMLTGSQWKGLVNENMRAINYLINKHFNFNSGVKDDLRSEGVRAIVVAAGAYEKKYDPQNPADWHRHLNNYARGFMQAELNKQVSGVVAMPDQKKRLFGRFKESHLQNDGDWNKIAADLNLKKKDLYPDLKGEEREEALPMEGYVSVSKQEKGTLGKKMQVHERRVNDIQERYMKDVSALDSRRAFDNPNAQKEFETYLLDYDSQIDVQRGKLSGANEDMKLAIEGKIKDLEQGKDLYSKSFKPITSEAEYDAEKKVLDTVLQSELRQAKAELDIDVDRTTVEGVNDLFRQFEGMMNMKEVNLSESRSNSEGDKSSNEDVIADESLTPSEKISIKEDYKQYVEKFLSDINKLDPRTATIVKMSLGLHEKNKLQSHGIWGYPMQPKEIAEALPSGTYSISGSTSYDSQVKSWEKSKPTQTVKVKMSEAEFKKEQLDYAKRQKETEDKIAKITPSLKEKYGANDRKKIIAKIRDNAKVGHHGDVDYRPKKFRQEKVSDSEYAQALSKWESSKPKMGRQRTLEDRIKQDIDLGISALRSISDKKNVANMQAAMADMRNYGIDSPKIKEGLQKATTFDDIWKSVDPEGMYVVHAKPTMVEKVKGAAVKLYDKIDLMFSFMKK